MMRYIMETRMYCTIVLMIIAISLKQVRGLPDSTAESDPDPGQGKIATNNDNNRCAGDSDWYHRRGNITCCQGKPLKNTFDIDYFFHNTKCFASMMVDGDDLPTSMHRFYLCMLKAGEHGITADNLATYQNFLKYMTQNYDEPMKSKILNNGAQCGGYFTSNSEKDEFKRFIKINNCFSETEGKICDPIFNRTYSDQFCKVAQQEENFDYNPLCCKGIRIPTYIPEVHYPIQRILEEEEAVHNCSMNFLNRQEELYRALNNTNHDLPNDCYEACMLPGNDFKSKADLTIDFDQIATVLYPTFSKTTRQDLMKILNNKYAVEKVYVMPDNSTLTIKETIKWMESQDELKHIEMYCQIHRYIASGLTSLAVRDYCHGPKANQVDSYSKYFNNFNKEQRHFD